MESTRLDALQEEFKKNISRKGTFEQGIEQCLYIHALYHRSEMSGIKEKTYEDELWGGLTDEMCRAMPNKKYATIAWCLWHISRIEDVVANLLIAKTDQVFESGKWQKKLNVKIKDTGNVMTDPEIMEFSNQINLEELKNYRLAVGRRTEEIIKSLKVEDIKKKAEPQSVQRIIDEGVVINQKGSLWLAEFWGNKTVAGLLMLPITRHLRMHLDEAMTVKNLGDLVF